MEGAKYNCLVVDDEPIARKIIINYIQQTPALHLSGECTNALHAIEYLKPSFNIDNAYTSCRCRQVFIIIVFDA